MKKKIDGQNNKKKAYESRTKAKTVGQKGQLTGQKKKKARLKRLRTISVIIHEK